MGLTKQYLRYLADGVFNITASSNCNIVFVVLKGQEGRYVAVGTSEDVTVWDLRLAEKVNLNTFYITYFNKCKIFYTYIHTVCKAYERSTVYLLGMIL
jgi:hypothetical protein